MFIYILYTNIHTFKRFTRALDTSSNLNWNHYRLLTPWFLTHKRHIYWFHATFYHYFNERRQPHVHKKRCLNRGLYYFKRMLYTKICVLALCNIGSFTRKNVYSWCLVRSTDMLFELSIYATHLCVCLFLFLLLLLSSIQHSFRLSKVV